MLVDDLSNTEWYDASKLTLFMLCPQKYEYRMLRNIVPTESDFALSFGIAIHKSLETIYNNTYNEVEDFEGASTYKYQAAFLRNYPTEPEKGPRTRTNGLVLLTHYIQKWSREPFQVLGVEVAFAKPERDFVLVGRMDLVIDWDGDVMPLDHKTTSRFGEFFELGFHLDPQLSIYIMALAETPHASGKPVSRAVINALRVTDKVSDESFLRKLTTRTPEELAYAKRLIHFVVDQIRSCERSALWPRHAPSACFAYNRVCEYYPMCCASAKQAALLEESAFAKRVWQPV